MPKHRNRPSSDDGGTGAGAVLPTTPVPGPDSEDPPEGETTDTAPAPFQAENPQPQVVLEVKPTPPGDDIQVTSTTEVNGVADAPIDRHAHPIHSLYLPSISMQRWPSLVGKCVVLLARVSETGAVDIEVVNRGGVIDFFVKRIEENARRPWEPARLKGGKPVTEQRHICYCWPGSARAPAPHCP